MDLVSVIDENSYEHVDMKYGKSLLGNMYTDANTKVNNDKNILKATKGNVELMKVMAFINFNEDYFNNKGIRIGDLKVISSYYEGIYHSYNTLKYNFAKLCEAFDLKAIYNLDKDRIKTTNPIENLISTIIGIEEIRDHKRLGFSNTGTAK
jgi:hypothetical protein